MSVAFCYHRYCGFVRPDALSIVKEVDGGHLHPPHPPHLDPSSSYLSALIPVVKSPAGCYLEAFRKELASKLEVTYHPLRTFLESSLPYLESSPPWSRRQ